MKKLALFFIALLLIAAGCTDNQRVKNWGGTATIELPANQKLVNITWKTDDVWYLTRPMRKGETAETYKFHEESSFGTMEGTYIVKELKTSK